ncbi:Putative fatty-acid--CoA ligase fadD21 [Mycobacterium basiliense]|uniref:Fatty-acid--CoA ligase fadD21 n=1 Tax=Mycobacterium basiliense TaxID=2094119 RepID=A0A447GDN7_9MYCO|nr:fatty acyl-AMP ligase [Mycobacterium basiliense]VDM88573.1 Putative fatty-acid--CoA ligase fadD21 [Mycobacterium basiliense]
MGRSPQNLARMLSDQVDSQSDQVAFGYLADGEDDLITLSYGELDSRARQIAVVLSDRIAPGGRVVLMCPPDLNFVAGLFGTLYAGLIPVPIYPPNPAAPEAYGARLADVVQDCSAEAVLTTALLKSMQTMVLDPAVSRRAVPWLATDDEDCLDADPADWTDPQIPSNAAALIQYTSGSTAAPKGVVLTHANFLANQVAIRQTFGIPEGPVAMNWLPPYHDMGLSGSLFAPIYRGGCGYLMSPMHFLQKPVRWLRAIDRVSATHSSSPNFGFELCLRRVSDEQKVGLDLSSWQVAFCGAEPVMADTARRFTQRFAEHGFRRGTFSPCYGLAEASLLVTGAVRELGPRTTWIDREKLAHGIAVVVDEGQPQAVQVVSSGRAPTDSTVAVVDQASGQELPSGQVGEIWVSGPSVAHGYWRRPELTETTFGARLPARDDGFLRTGDLGFKLGDELYVTGRIKDIIIIAGRNIYPQDIELAVQRADTRLRPGCGAAFGIVVDEAESIAIVQETAEEDRSELDLLVKAARKAVLEAHQIDPAAVVLTPARSLPKTTSGKLRRAAIRTAFLDGSLPVVAQLATRTYE